MSTMTFVIMSEHVGVAVARCCHATGAGPVRAVHFSAD